MDYEPFDFDKLDRLLGDYSELDDPEWVALRRRSNQATQPEPQQSSIAAMNPQPLKTGARSS